MQSLTRIVALILILGTIGCVEPEEVTLVRSCGSFDFTVPERDWIVFHPDEFQFQNFSSLSFDGKQFLNVFKISHSNPNKRPQEIFLARRLGLVVFVDKDSLWVRD